MTIHHTIAGVDQVDSSSRIKGPILSLTSAADGTLATSGAIILDPTGTLGYAQLQEWITEETDCSQPRSFTGRIFGMTVTRGPYVTGPGRQYEFEIDDLNGLLHMSVIKGAGGKRDAETGSARIAWLLTTRGMSGVVFDNGLIVPNVLMYDAADYRGQYADDVLQSIVSANDLGRIFFVYWDAAAAQPSLFYASPNAAIHDSTLRISNVDADLDAVTFQPLPEPTLESAGSGIYCGVFIKWTTGQLYKHSATTHAAFFSTTPNLHRDGVLESSRINNATTANAHADKFLDRHSGQLDTIKCTVKLPSSKVNLIEAGMRIQCRFNQLTGYETMTWSRVTRRTLVVPVEKAKKFYDVQLELSTRGINQAGGGGDPGVFPAPPSCSAATMGIVQSAVAGATTLVLPSAPIVGNTLFWFVFSRAAGTYVPPLGTWIHVVDRATDNASAFALYYKYVEVGDPASWTLTPNGTTGSKAVMVEALGQLTYGVSDKTGAGFNANAALISLTPAAGKVALLLSSTTIADDVLDHAIGPAAGMSELAELGPAGPQAAVNYQIVASTTGSYSVGSSWADDPSGLAPSAQLGAAFYCALSDNPPSPGQWVGINPPEYVTMSGVNGTTAFAFADGSLRVFYDNVEQTAAIISYDGAARTFVMAGAPLPGWQVRVEYQAR